MFKYMCNMWKLYRRIVLKLELIFMYCISYLYVSHIVLLRKFMMELNFKDFCNDY